MILIFSFVCLTGEEVGGMSVWKNHSARSRRVASGKRQNLTHKPGLYSIVRSEAQQNISQYKSIAWIQEPIPIIFLSIYLSI